MDIFNMGVIGLGGWGKNVLRSFSQTQGVKLYGICDENPDTVEKHGSLYPQAKATTEYHELLNDPNIEAIALATPSPTHFQLVRESLEAGKHVFVEKPMSLTVEDAQTLVTLSEQRKRVLMVGHLLEYHPAVDVLKTLICDGELGDIYYIYSHRLNLGVVRLEENALWSLAPHDISVVLYLLEQEPTHVTAVGQSYLNPGVEDVVFANLRFGNEHTAQIHVSWLDPHKERKLVIVGSKRMAVFDDMHPSEKVRVFDKSANVKVGSADFVETITVRHGEIRSLIVPNQEPLLNETQHFADCVLEGKTPRSDAHDGLRVVKILDAATRSLKENGMPMEIQ